MYINTIILTEGLIAYPQIGFTNKAYRAVRARVKTLPAMRRAMSVNGADPLTSGNPSYRVSLQKAYEHERLLE